MQDVRERLLFFIKCQNLSNQAFEKKIGLSNGSVAKTKRLGDDKINKILDIYPNLNRIWLLTGEGEMLVTPNISATNNGTIGGDMNVAQLIEKYPTNAIKENVEGVAVEEIPIIPTDVYQMPEVDVKEYIQENASVVNTSPLVHQFPKFSMWYEVYGDSMLPKFEPGDLIAINPYPKGKEVVLNKRYYVVDTYSNGLVLCMLIKEGNGYVARYKNAEYADDYINQDDIIRIYKVVGQIRITL